MILRSYRKNDSYKGSGSFQNLDSCLLSGRRTRLPEKRLIRNLAAVFAIFVLLMPVFIFVSCTDAVNPPVPVNPTPEKPIPTNPVQIPTKIVTISGRMTAANLDENGAIPSFFAGDAQGSRAAYGADSEENASSRMAIPTIDLENIGVDNDTYYVKATATKRNGTDLSEPVEREGTVTFGDTPGTGSFSIALETGYNWTIELGMRWCDGYENE